MTAASDANCGLCGRVADEPQTFIDDRPVCAACYLREFHPVGCDKCGKATRAHPSQSGALCRSCKSLAKPKCVRCAKPVAKRSFNVEGGQACSYCRRFFEPPKVCPKCGEESRHFSVNKALSLHEPVCNRCASAASETCSGCRKYRLVYARTQEGRPLCRACREDGEFICPTCTLTGVRHSKDECAPCYYRRALAAEAAALAPQIESAWAQAAFRDFAKQWCQAHPEGKSIAKLRRYARFFVVLGQRHRSADVVSEQSLLESFEADGLRRHAVPYRWLLEQGAIPAVPAEVAEDYSGTRTRQRLLARMKEPWKLEVLKRYENFLVRVRRRWQKRGWTGEHERFQEHTVTLLLRAAWRFLEALTDDVTSVQGIDRLELARFILDQPGHRNSLHSFVRYLNRKERLFQKLHIERSEPTSAPYANLLSPRRSAELTQRWLSCEPNTPARNPLMFLFMLLYARTSEQTCRLRRQDFVVDEGGSIQARFGPVAIRLEPRVGELWKRYVDELERQLQRSLAPDDYLFPGLQPGRHFSLTGLKHHLKKEGVTANELYTTALASFFRAEGRHPKVLVRALGIGDRTAIKYFEMFAPRVNEELAHP